MPSTKSEMGENHTGTEEIQDIHSIELDNICFAYEDEKPNSVNNMTLNFKKGEKVAILGRIGSGKSTVINIMAGILKPTSGSYKVNGIDFNKIKIEKTRTVVDTILASNPKLPPV